MVLFQTSLFPVSFSLRKQATHRLPAILIVRIILLLHFLALNGVGLAVTEDEELSHLFIQNPVHFCTKMRIIGICNRNLVQICSKIRISICIIQKKYYLCKRQELQSLKRIDDSFHKIVIVGDDIASWTDENGISYIGLFQFLQKACRFDVSPYIQEDVPT